MITLDPRICRNGSILKILDNDIIIAKLSPGINGRLAWEIITPTPGITVVRSELVIQSLIRPAYITFQK